MEVEVAEMRPEEAASVQALWKRAGLVRPWNDPVKDMEFALRSPNAAILVGRVGHGRRIVASCMVGHDGHRSAIYYVATDTDLRGLGHGRAVMAAAEDWLRGKGVWKVNLLIRAENHAVKGFYEALGYVAQDRIAMGKDIAPET